MIIIPAVDIIGGKVVRLAKGSFKEVKEYSDNPILMAKFWHEQGAKYLHIVDLDGATTGKPTNLYIIKEILKEISIPAEVGGGVRTVSDINIYLSMGVDRVVLGTSVANDLSFLDKGQIKAIANRVSVSCDVRMGVDKTNDKILTGTEGWLKEVAISIEALLEKMVSVGIKYLNYTDRSKDGTLSGLTQDDISSLDSFLNLIGNSPIELIYAGGISSLDDISKISNLRNKKLSGIIIGKALYENKFSLKQAQEVADVG